MGAMLLVSVALGVAPLSLGEVLASCDAHLPALAAARAEVDAAAGERLAAEGAFDPAWRTRGWSVPGSGYPQHRVDTVVEAPTSLWGANLFGGYRWATGKFQDYYASRETWTAGELRAGAVVPLLRNGPIDRRRASVARAEAGEEAAAEGLEQQRLDVARLASVRYWEWVAAGQRKAVAAALLQLAKDRDAQLAARAAAGEVATFDRQDNARALVQREAQLVQASRALEQAALELSLYLRDGEGGPVVPDEARLPGALPVPAELPEEAGTVEEAVARRPELRRLGALARQQAVETRLGQNQLWPALDVGVAVSKDLGLAGRPEASSLGPVEVEFNAVLDVPLLLRAPRGRLDAVRAAAARVEAQRQQAAERVAVEVRDARSALQAARVRAVLGAEEVTVAAAVEQGERQRFELGEGTLLFVNLREQATAEARLRELEARLDFQRARAALRAALGFPAS